MLKASFNSAGMMYPSATGTVPKRGRAAGWFFSESDMKTSFSPLSSNGSKVPVPTDLRGGETFFYPFFIHCPWQKHDEQEPILSKWIKILLYKTSVRILQSKEKGRSREEAFPLDRPLGEFSSGSKQMKKDHQTACHNSPLMVSTLHPGHNDFHVEIRKKSNWH